ncbi:MAG TPA: metalloregulator ArsR/SmtB family transcription factor [Micromonosporaceae bacterium]|jgi:ArsR family transcriptional regulator
MSKSLPVVAGPGCCAPISEAPIGPADAASLSTAFKALSDPIRLQLLSMIASHPSGEVCVCDLTPAFAVSGPTISHHLRVLREAGLIDHERRGTWVYYRPVGDRLSALSQLLEMSPDAVAAA